jgi:glycosyltransferase involved in cell wall biosynthesis
LVDALGRHVSAPLRAESEAPDFIAVVVPARNEETCIGLCLSNLDRARRHRAVRSVDTRIIVVLDCCTDETAARTLALLRANDRAVAISEGNVGAARRAGFAHALAMTSAPLDKVWLATTDADSTVRSHWLARQLRWRDRGFAGVAGTIRVDSWKQYAPHTRGRFRAHMSRLGTGPGHPHVYGANLAFSAAAYTAVGGVPALETGEDHALWRRFAESGYRLAATDDIAVVTSGRSVGRAPHGFAGLLGQLSASRGTATASAASDLSRLDYPL